MNPKMITSSSSPGTINSQPYTDNYFPESNFNWDSVETSSTEMSTPVASNTNSPKFQQLQYNYYPQVDSTFLSSHNFFDETTPCDLSSAFSTLDTPLLEPALLESVAWNIDRFVAPTPVISHPQVRFEEPSLSTNTQINNASSIRKESLNHLSAQSTRAQRSERHERNTRSAHTKRAKSSASIDESVLSDNASSQDSQGERLTEKRRRNKLAARRLRQKKLDQLSELECQLDEMKKERDELRIQAAKWEGEAKALRQMVDQRIGN